MTDSDFNCIHFTWCPFTFGCSWSILCTCHVVMHPVEHNLRGTVPPGGYVARHLVVCVPRQTKVQDLRDKERLWIFSTPRGYLNDTLNLVSSRPFLTLSSQSSFTARLLGFKSWRDKKEKSRLDTEVLEKYPSDLRLSLFRLTTHPMWNSLFWLLVGGLISMRHLTSEQENLSGLKRIETH